MNARGVLVGAVAVAVALTLALSGLLAGLEDATSDARFRLRPATPPADVVIVALDERSLDVIGKPPPIPRSLHAGLLDRLRNLHPSVIAYDVQFTEPSQPDEDEALYAAVSRTRPVVLGTTDVTTAGDTRVFGTTAHVEAAGARVGVTLLPLSRGGIFRRVEPRVHGVETLSFAAARAAGRAPREEIDRAGALIDYAGPPGTVTTLSFADVLEGRVPVQAVRGRAVVVGITALSEGDRHRVPTASSDLMAGAEIQANALSTVLRGLPLRDAPSWTGAVLAALLAALGAALGRRLTSWRLGVATGIGIAAIGVASYVAFLAGVMVPTAVAAVALLVGLAIGAAARELEARRRERVLRDVLARLAGGRDIDELVARVHAAELVILSPGTTFGDYDVDRALGVGAMSVVHLARHRPTARLVALKVMSAKLGDRPEMRDRFIREGQAGRALRHESVVEVLDAGEVRGRLYIAMRLVEGGTLADLIGGPEFTPIRAIALLRPIARALDHAHARSVIHRDVKPSNILVDGDGHAYLADFGIAYLLDATRLTTEFVGTPAYTAPEQIRGEALTGACDQYSLACVLFECLTGRVPFATRSVHSMLHAHVAERPPAPSSLSRRMTRTVDRALLRGLAKQPDQRYGSCQALLNAVAAALGSRALPSGDHAAPPSDPSQPTMPFDTAF